jgi:hypothetical protein
MVEGGGGGGGGGVLVEAGGGKNACFGVSSLLSPATLAPTSSLLTPPTFDRAMLNPEFFWIHQAALLNFVSGFERGPFSAANTFGYSDSEPEKSF